MGSDIFNAGKKAGKEAANGAKETFGKGKKFGKKVHDTGSDAGKRVNEE